MKSLDLNTIVCALGLFALATYLPALDSQASPAAAATQPPRAVASATPNVPDIDDECPRVTELEQQLFGQTYMKEPLPQRLTRLETKAFGKSYPNTPLCDRVDKLNEYSPSKYKPTYETDPGEDAATADTANGANTTGGAGTSSASKTSTDGAGSQYSPSDYGNYPRVTALEQKVLGKTYEKDPLPVRVARLETKQFGKASPSDDLADRLDRLDKAVDPHGNALATDGPASSDQNASQPGGRGSSGGGFGRSLLNMVGSSMLGMGGAGPGIGNPSGIGYGVGNTYEPDAPKSTDVANPFLSSATPTKGLENKTSVMERFVFGSEHGNQPIAERVQHLEKKLVPYEHHKGDDDLNARVDHLWSILSAANKVDKEVAQ
ncbi:MAG TPA: hypothetical protein V6C69_08495 [Trichormus sp.]|jgi:hypothetical protein